MEDISMIIIDTLAYIVLPIICVYFISTDGRRKKGSACFTSSDKPLEVELEINKANQYMERQREKMDRSFEKTQEDMDRATKEMSETMDRMSEEIRPKREKMQEKIQEDMREKMREDMDRMSRSFEKMREDMDRATKENQKRDTTEAFQIKKDAREAGT